ncbi:MAG: FHA domain-containing protein [Spirochaetales bacterium]|nr:FHA domain-containing protein [Spirochaetales bacterium]
MNKAHGSRRDSKASTIINPDYRKVRPAGLLGQRALLVVLSENLFGQAFVLSEARSLLGRGSGCQIMIEDPLISREHCVIGYDDRGCYFLEDLGSKNGTVLNRKTLSRKAALHYGDRIVVGDTILRFLLEERIDRK